MPLCPEKRPQRSPPAIAARPALSPPVPLRGPAPGRVPAEGESAAGPEAEIVTWYVPHESGRRLAVLTFSTPNVGLADEFGEVFDALADTLRRTA